MTPEGQILSQPFLDIRHKIVRQWPQFDEKGLLGLAFHPDFANNGKFYVAYSAPFNWAGDLGHEDLVVAHQRRSRSTRSPRTIPTRRIRTYGAA